MPRRPAGRAQRVEVAGAAADSREDVLSPGRRACSGQHNGRHPPEDKPEGRRRPPRYAATTSSAGPATRPPSSVLTLADGLARACATHTGVALRHPAPEGWTDVTYAQLDARVRAVASGLLALGVGRGDRVAILSQTRAEWTVADLAALSVGATVVPVYETSSAQECRYVVEHSEARAVFCEDREQLGKLSGRGRPPALRDAILFEGDDGDGISLDELAERGAGHDSAELDARRAEVEPDDVASIVYTSGTTGPPKGCRLTHAALWANASMVLERVSMGSDHVLFAFLPLAHVLTRMTQLVALRAGATLGYWSRRMDAVLDDLATLRPTHLPSVPRVFEKAHAKAHASALEGGPVKAALFRAATATGRRAAAQRRRGRTPPPALRLAHLAADRVVLSRVRAVFGGRLEFAVSGGAPIEPAILEFFDACGVPVLEGYGMTETSAVSTLNTLAERRFGTVGRALPRCEVRIADDGEVLIRGPHLFAGYERDPEATAAALREGWLHSGDLGSLSEDGFLTLTGRKREIIVTSSGKNVSPANVENALKASPWVAQAMVHGDRRPYLVALITLDAVEAPELARRLGVDSLDAEALALDPRVHRELARVVAEANAQFAPIEQVKRFAVLPRELNQQDGELTATLKVKRRVVEDRYATRLEGLYGDRPGPGDVWLERTAAGSPG